MSSIKDKKIKEFLEELSSDSPTPGGGAVAALVGSLAASLVEMVASLTIGKKGCEKVNEKMKRVRKQAINLKQKLLLLSDKDVKVFNQVMRVYRLAKEEKGRKIKIQNALKKATEIPLETAVLSNEVLKLAREVTKKGNKNARSDAKSAEFLAKAAIGSALENVKINLDSIDDLEWKKKINSKSLLLRKAL